MNAEGLSQIVTPWAAGLNYRIRIYFFGSRLHGTHRPDSDLDLAIEFIELWCDTTLLWFDFHDLWQNKLSAMTGLNVHLELYDGKNKNIRKYIKEKAAIIFESAEEPENDDLSSLTPPDFLLNIESSDDE